MKYQIDINENNDDVGLIIMAPGVLGYGDETHMVSLSKELTDFGYRVIRFTPNCLAKDTDGILSNYSQTNIYKEMKAILESYFINTDFDRSAVIPIGFSAGGPIAMKYASENPVKAVINVVSPYQVTNGDDLSEMDWSEGFITMKSSLLSEVKLPESYRVDSQNFNSLDYIENVKVPKLFVIGDNDKQVPNNLTYVLYEKSPEPKQIEVIKGMPHRYKDSSSFTMQVNELVRSFVSGL